MRNIKKILTEFMTYDRVYYDRKLSSLLIVILSFLSILCFIIGFIILK